MCGPAWKGLQNLSQPVDTLILGDSVARVNLSAGQWHDLGLGDVFNLGNSSVSGGESDVTMLRNYLARFGPPKRVCLVRHLGAYLDDAVKGFLIEIMEPFAVLHLQIKGNWPRTPIINDNRGVGLPPDLELVKQFVKLRPKWLVGPWQIAPSNREALKTMAKLCETYRIKLSCAIGPTCSLIKDEAYAMRAEWIHECYRHNIPAIYDNLLFDAYQMQDPNHLTPFQAEKWSAWLAGEVLAMDGKHET
jgi:hypothetical protein